MPGFPFGGPNGCRNGDESAQKKGCFFCALFVHFLAFFEGLFVVLGLFGKPFSELLGLPGQWNIWAGQTRWADERNIRAGQTR